eukprot:m.464380 g.464380  ORF g.464380 m.464380 type:complete len:112 (+) comp23471_c0_seq1:1112-1447(+)
MVVNGTEHGWVDGEAILFNDSYPHTAYNHTSDERTVLLIEHWNPAVPYHARKLLSAFVATWSAVAPTAVLRLNEIDRLFRFDGRDFPKRKIKQSTREDTGNDTVPWANFMD